MSQSEWTCHSRRQVKLDEHDTLKEQVNPGEHIILEEQVHLLCQHQLLLRLSFVSRNEVRGSTEYPKKSSNAQDNDYLKICTHKN